MVNNFWCEWSKKVRMLICAWNYCGEVDLKGQSFVVIILLCYLSQQCCTSGKTTDFNLLTVKLHLARCSTICVKARLYKSGFGLGLSYAHHKTYYGRDRNDGPRRWSPGTFEGSTEPNQDNWSPEALILVSRVGGSAENPTALKPLELCYELLNSGKLKKKKKKEKKSWSWQELL